MILDQTNNDLLVHQPDFEMDNNLNINTILFSLTSYFKTGNFILDSLLISLVGSFAFWLVSYLGTLKEKLAEFSIRNWYTNWKLSYYKSVTLRYERGIIKKSEIYSSYENWDDDYVIDAVLFNLGKDGTTNQEMAYSAKFERDGDRSNSLNQLYKKGKFTYQPNFLVKYRDLYISYSVHNTCQAENEYTKYKRVLTVYAPKSLQEIEDYLDECVAKFTDFKWPDKDYTPIYAIKHADKIWERYERMTEKEDNRPPNEFYYYDFHPCKTTEDLFFPEKELLFRKYEEFLEDPKQDKFCVLLYGKPGTGKSSLIEAFAHEFDLSIMEASFDSFIDDQALIDYFHNDRVYKRESNKDRIGRSFRKIPLDKRLYLFEDFDSSSKVVLDRKKFQWKKDADADAESDSDSDSDSSDSEEETEVSALEKKLKKLKGEDKKKKKKKKDKNKLKKFDVQEFKDSSIVSMVMDPQINLKNLLNVFGGVFKLEKSVIFLTTNHLDVIDPALIRPGRVNFRIRMGEISYEMALKMVKHLNSDFDIENPALQELLEMVKILPCQLEQFCQMSESTEDLIGYLSGVK